MQRIYMHSYRENQEHQFNPELLLEHQQESLGNSHKPSYGLWGSAFNDKSPNQWEKFFSVEFNPDAFKNYIEIDSISYEKFPEHLAARGLTQEEFDALDSDDKEPILMEYESQFPAPSSEDYKKAEALDAQNRLLFVANMRENSFYFAVDQGKILHIKSEKDIDPYLTKSRHGVTCVDFDKIKNEGFGGLELHNAKALHNTVFYTWDIDSIVIWDPSCVIPVEKEIAHIARSLAEATNEFDTYDVLSNDVNLGYWIAEHMDIVQNSITNGILDAQEVEKFIAHAIELDNNSRDTEQTIETPDHGR